MFEVDFSYVHDQVYNAYTLPADAVYSSKDEQFNKKLSRLHEDGWLISGFVTEDWFLWVNNFDATHEVYGRVWGNFENKVFADSEAGYKHFILHHPPQAWCYEDI